MSILGLVMIPHPINSIYFLIMSFHLMLQNFADSLNIQQCNRALGMESRRIESLQITASSSFDEQSTGPKNARIRTEHGSGAWCPATQINASSHEWIQVDLKAENVVTGIETQGRWDKGRGMEFPVGYMVEYWRDSLGRWARYRDFQGNEIINGNSDTQSAVLRILDGGIVARLIRLIPVSEATRTICMRFELYGCTYQENLMSYSMLDGVMADGLDLRDTSYDGIVENGNHLNGGLGRLFDGVTGDNNLEKNPNGWVGWRRDRLNEIDHITIDSQFSSRQNISSIILHASNFHPYGTKVFQRARIYFLSALHFGEKRESPLKSDEFEISETLNSKEFSSSVIEFDYPTDETLDTSRWVRIPISPSRIANRLRMELYFADGTDWILLSEIKYESENIPFKVAWLMDEQRIDEMKIVGGNFYYSNSSTHDNEQGLQFKCFVIGLVLVGSIVICAVLVGSFYFIAILCRKDSSLKKSKAFKSRDVSSKSLMKVILNNSKYTTTTQPTLSPINTKAKNRMCMKRSTTDAWNTFKTSIDSSSTEYADPDVESNLAQPLLKQVANSVYSSGLAGGVLSSYDLMSRSVASSAESSRYRATPSASAFESLSKFANANFSKMNPSQIEDYHGVKGLQTNSDNNNEHHCSQNYDDYDEDGYNGEIAENFLTNKIKAGYRCQFLPDFDLLALHFVKQLGVTGIGEHRVDLCRMDADRLVAVINCNKEKEKFRNEIEVLSRLRHFNILRIIGTASRLSITPHACNSDNYSISSAYIIEFMPNGDLRQFLLNRHMNTSDETLISFATQIAAGMAYLESCGFVHKNLMARNCLLDTDGTVKIGFEELRLNEPCDMRYLYHVNSLSQNRLPVRWMAWESLNTGLFNLKSDVWSFGVTLWELFSECVERPYDSLSDQEVVEAARTLTSISVMPELFPGALSIPNRCSQFLYDELILTCWRIEPSTRPTFSELHRILQNLTLTQIAPKILNTRNFSFQS